MKSSPSLPQDKFEALVNFIKDSPAILSTVEEERKKGILELVRAKGMLPPLSMLLKRSTNDQFFNLVLLLLQAVNEVRAEDIVNDETINHVLEGARNAGRQDVMEVANKILSSKQEEVKLIEEREKKQKREERVKRFSELWEGLDQDLKRDEDEEVFFETKQYQEIKNLMAEAVEQPTELDRNLKEALRKARALGSVIIVRYLLQIGREVIGGINYDTAGIKDTFMWAFLEGHKGIVDAIASLRGFNHEEDLAKAKKFKEAIEYIEGSDLSHQNKKAAINAIMKAVSEGLDWFDQALNLAVTNNNLVLARALLAATNGDTTYDAANVEAALKWARDNRHDDIVAELSSRIARQEANRKALAAGVASFSQTVDHGGEEVKEEVKKEVATERVKRFSELWEGLDRDLKRDDEEFFGTKQYQEIKNLMADAVEQPSELDRNLKEALRKARGLGSVIIVRYLLQIGRDVIGGINYDTAGIKGTFMWAFLEDHTDIVDAIASLRGFNREEDLAKANKFKEAIDHIKGSNLPPRNKGEAQNVITKLAIQGPETFDQALNLAVTNNNVVLARALLAATNGDTTYDAANVEAALKWANDNGHDDIVAELSSRKEKKREEMIHRFPELQHIINPGETFSEWQTRTHQKIIKLVEDAIDDPQKLSENLDVALKLAVTLNSVPLANSLLRMRISEFQVSNYSLPGINRAYKWAIIEGHTEIADTISSLEGIDVVTLNREIEERERKIRGVFEGVKKQLENDGEDRLVIGLEPWRPTRLDEALKEAKGNRTLLQGLLKIIEGDDIVYAGEGVEQIFRESLMLLRRETTTLLLRKRELEFGVGEKCREAMLSGDKSLRVLIESMLKGEGSRRVVQRFDRVVIMDLASRQEYLPILEEFIPNKKQREDLIKAVRAIDLLRLTYSEEDWGQLGAIVNEHIIQSMSEINFSNKEVFLNAARAIKEGGFQHGNDGERFKIMCVPYTTHLAYFLIKYDQRNRPVELSYIDGNCILSDTPREYNKYHAGVVNFIVDQQRLKRLNLESPEEFEEYLSREFRGAYPGSDTGGVHGSGADVIMRRLSNVVMSSIDPRDPSLGARPIVSSVSIPTEPQKRGNCGFKGLSILLRRVSELMDAKMKFGTYTPAGEGTDSYKEWKHGMNEGSLQVLEEMNKSGDSLIPEQITKTLKLCSEHRKEKYNRQLQPSSHILRSEEILRLMSGPSRNNPFR